MKNKNKMEKIEYNYLFNQSKYWKEYRSIGNELITIVEQHRIIPIEECKTIIGTILKKNDMRVINIRYNVLKMAKLIIELNNSVCTIAPIRTWKNWSSIFQCLDCGRLHEVIQNKKDYVIPIKCQECGSKRFILDLTECRILV